MRSARADRCLRCRLLSAFCLCAEVTPMATRTRVVIVRHILEAPKVSGTGRLAALGLSNSLLLCWGDPGGFDPAPLTGPATVLVYPEGPVSSGAGGPCDSPGTLVFLDGTWGQARRMRQRITALRGLPILSLPAGGRGPARLRRAPRPEALSTIEAIAHALEIVEGQEPAAHLRRLFALFISRCRAHGRT